MLTHVKHLNKHAETKLHYLFLTFKLSIVYLVIGNIFFLSIRLNMPIITAALYIQIYAVTRLLASMVTSTYREPETPK